jgi:hypothetical protein
LRLASTLLEEALTIHPAFTHCCSEECGVEPEKLVKVWSGPMLLEVERLKHLLDSPEVTPEMLKEYKVAFKKVRSEIAA